MRLARHLQPFVAVDLVIADDAADSFGEDLGAAPGEAIEARRAQLAVRGDGYFVVTTPAGPRLTRGGAFSIRADGALVNEAGRMYAIATTERRAEATQAPAPEGAP